MLSPRPNARQIGRSLAALGLFGLVLTGCVRFLEPRSSNITYYLLDNSVEADTPSTDTTGLRVGFRQPQIASYLDASRIVSRQGPNTVRFSDVHRWGEDLDQALNRVVAVSLEEKEGIQSTEVVPWPQGASFDYVVQLRVLRFEGVGPPPDPEVDDEDTVREGHSQIAVRWTILGPDGENVRARGLTRHREDGWTVNDYADLASKLGASLNVLAEDLSTQLQALARE